MLLRFAQRLFSETDGRLLWRFAFNFALRSPLSLLRFKRRGKKGVCFPAVLFVSITNRCNLRCRGCWVTVGDGSAASLPLPALERIIVQSKRRGNFFFGLLGGEPLMYDGLWDLLERHRDCCFQVLTNGTLIDDEIARRMRRAGNVTPLVSIEGRGEVGDTRRGGRDVYNRTLAGLEHCRRNRLLTGVATSLCRSNIRDLATEQFIRELVDRGVHYVWYYIYRPVGPRPSPELALSQREIVELRRFIVRTRTWAPLLIVDAYWDHLGRALCPAAAGITHHVNAFGDVEPCPPIQFARDRAGNGDLFETIVGSRFLSGFRRMAAATTRGCVLMERPDVLRSFLVQQEARDSSGRRTGLDELAAMRPRPSHETPGAEIPEQHWAYRFAKKHWFFGFGAYG